MMRSKEFYEGSIIQLQKMVKRGICILLFDAFAVSFAAGISFNTLMDSKRQLDMYKADMELYYTKEK